MKMFHWNFFKKFKWKLFQKLLWKFSRCSSGILSWIPLEIFLDLFVIASTIPYGKFFGSCSDFFFLKVALWIVPLILFEQLLGIRWKVIPIFLKLREELFSPDINQKVNRRFSQMVIISFLGKLYQKFLRKILWKLQWKFLRKFFSQEASRTP